MQDEILNYILSIESGVTEDQLATHFPLLTHSIITKHLTSLTRNNSLSIHNDGKQLLYKKPQYDEEKIIYNLIAENKGLWLRDIKQKSNIPQTLINKIIKNMENKKLIKSVKSIKNNRKIYLLYDEIITSEISGGVFFNMGDVDTEFVEQLMRIVCKYICDRNNKCFDGNDVNLSLQGIKEYLERSKIMQVKVEVCDVENLLKVMEYEGMVQGIKVGDKRIYRCIK